MTNEYGWYTSLRWPDTVWPCQAKTVFEHAQNVRIHIILRMRKVSAGICSPLIHSVVSNDSGSGQWRPWSDCADAQADLGLRCPHMPEDMFSHGTVRLIDVTPLSVWDNFCICMFCFCNLLFRSSCIIKNSQSSNDQTRNRGPTYQNYQPLHLRWDTIISSMRNTPTLFKRCNNPNFKALKCYSQLQQTTFWFFFS